MKWPTEERYDEALGEGIGIMFSDVGLHRFYSPMLSNVAISFMKNNLHGLELEIERESLDEYIK